MEPSTPRTSEADRTRFRLRLALAGLLYLLGVLGYVTWAYREAQKDVMASVDQRLEAGTRGLKYLLAPDFHDRARGPEPPTHGLQAAGCSLEPGNKSGRYGRPEVQCGAEKRAEQKKVRSRKKREAEELALVAEEVLAGSRCVVNFVLASEQGSQVFVDVVHISPRGFL